MPLLVLRNHDQFDPLVPGHPFSLDTTRLAAQLRKLLLPAQRLTLLPSTHDMHAHPQLSVAVSRAMQATAPPTPPPHPNLHRHPTRPCPRRHASPGASR